MDIFVGNLLFEATEADVKKLFEGFGNVASVVIVMRKEKKAPKSRGFGFVQMPDERQALAAIAALNGKEFMGRVLNANPARPKTEAQTVVELNKKGQPGIYRGGRRTRSYISRLGLAGIQEEVKPRRRNQDNPMRWRKRGDKPRPWQKNPGEHKPWEKVEGGVRPRKKAEGESNPWRKSEGGIKPWKKPAGDVNPWSKSSRRPQESRFNSSASFASAPGVRQASVSARGGKVRANGERSRGKGRKIPGGYKR
jgi:RNA recognition motif-containing protein